MVLAAFSRVGPNTEGSKRGFRSCGSRSYRAFGRFAYLDELDYNYAAGVKLYFCPVNYNIYVNACCVRAGRVINTLRATLYATLRALRDQRAATTILQFSLHFFAGASPTSTRWVEPGVASRAQYLVALIAKHDDVISPLCPRQLRRSLGRVLLTVRVSRVCAVAPEKGANARARCQRAVDDAGPVEIAVAGRQIGKRACGCCV